MLDHETARNMVVACWRTGDFDAGRFACDRVRCLFDAEPRVVGETRRNECFSVVPFGSSAREFAAWRVDPGIEGRPGPLARSIGTVLERALRPEEIESLLAVDRDDTETLPSLPPPPSLPARPSQVRAVVVERREYARLQEYMNLLARLALGYRTLRWNDDNLMETRYRDEVISREPDCIGALPSVHSPGNVTPAVPRHWLTLLARYSAHNHNHNDSSWDWMAHRIRLARTIEVEFVHDRADLTGNNEDGTYRERVLDGEGFLSESTQQANQREGNRLREWIAFEQSLAGDLAGATASEGA